MTAVAATTTTTRNMFSARVTRNVSSIDSLVALLIDFAFILSVKNRHHTALFIQNNYLKLLIRKGPLATSSPTKYASEWMWKVAEINDNRWHSYKVVVNYPEKVRTTKTSTGRIVTVFSPLADRFVRRWPPRRAQQGQLPRGGRHSTERSRRHGGHDLRAGRLLAR